MAGAVPARARFSGDEEPIVEALSPLFGFPNAFVYPEADDARPVPEQLKAAKELIRVFNTAHPPMIFKRSTLVSIYTSILAKKSPEWATRMDDIS